MIEEEPVIEVGSTLRLWDEASNSFSKKALCVSVERKTKMKNNSMFKYKLKLKKDGSIVKTRLGTELKWKRKKHIRHEQHLSLVSQMPPGGNKAVVRLKMEQIDVTRICAPMVGGSELAFRILTRRHGATLCYTPMISSAKFPHDEQYRKDEFQTTSEDRPLVAHFSANDPAQLLQSSLLVKDQCDAIDLNLGCPQRIAHTGHFGSYLLDSVDRPLVLSIVKTLSDSIDIPVFVKIRLLDSVPATIELVQQLREAGASLVCIHARYRVNLVGRTGAGARDGPAMLDQVAEVRRAVPSDLILISNGNIREYSDLAENQASTGTQGVMSAEGLLDNPALFAPPDKQPSRVDLAMEYLDLVDQHPVKLKSVIFHVRRICKEQFNGYQLMEECVQSKSVQEVRDVVLMAKRYDMEGYTFDPEKERKAKAALAKRKHEEGKRKRFEERMARKAKREGKDPGHYLSIGAECPSVEGLAKLKAMTREAAFEIWKERHSQHCFDFHLKADGGCGRDRACAFLHADPSYVSGQSEVFG